MAIAKNKSPYASELQGTTLETSTILSQLLRPIGYNKDVIDDISIGIFIENERNSIGAQSNMHLFSLKKTLLYAIPVVAPKSSVIGIKLSSQVSCPAIQYNITKNVAKHMAIAIGDQFRLIGFAFPPTLINHLSHDIFKWKFFIKHEHTPTPIDLSYLPEIITKQTQCGTIFLIDQKNYENTALFNHINKVISSKMIQTMDAAFAMKVPEKTVHMVQLERIKPFQSHSFIKELNSVIRRQIDATFSMSYYEACQMTSNWLLYDQIMLQGFDSNEVQQQIQHLKYVKEQSLKVQSNLIQTNQNRLLNTRAEKIARERYPYYFDFADRRAIFVKFKQFDIDKLPRKERSDILLLLKKDLAAQHALLHNNCNHTKSLNNFVELEPFIDYDSLDEDGMYQCKLCNFPLVCVHAVELEETLSSIVNAIDDSDQVYRARKTIINKYKSTSRKRTGVEDTTVSFTFYCKFCGEELGKSDDNIQTTTKTQAESSTVTDIDPNIALIYQGIYIVVHQHMNEEKVPIGKKTLAKILFEECKDDILQYVNRATKRQMNDIDTFIRYISMVYALVGLVSINTNKFKIHTSIFKKSVTKSPTKEDETLDPEIVDGGSIALKDELVAALRIVQSIQSFKRIGITEDKTKSLIIECFKSVNKIFSNDVYSIKASSPRDILEADIKCSPLPTFAAYMMWRETKKHVNGMTASGVDLDSLYSKKPSNPSSHALYKNVFTPSRKETSDRGKYILESYKTIMDVATLEPINKRYISIVNPSVSKAALEYETKLSKYIKATRTTPTKYLPVENGREYDFTLTNYHIAYCYDNGSTRAHRWTMVKNKNSLLFSCKYCKLNIESVSKTLNDKINEKLMEQMTKEAFFELYTLSCPIKDAHVFESDMCSQCKVTKQELNDMNTSYYKKYAPTYLAYRNGITKSLLQAMNSIVYFSREYKPSVTKVISDKPDVIKLESLVMSLSKLYNHKNINTIGMDLSGIRSLEVVESYVRLFYSYYTFVKNISIDMKGHPDVAFMSFIKTKFFNGVKPKDIKLPELPPFPTSQNADTLLILLFDNMYSMAGKGETNELVQFILGKIIAQQSKRQAFNFAKLKSVNVNLTEDGLFQSQTADLEDEDEFDMFDGYDMSQEDMEDNIDGEYD